MSSPSTHAREVLPRHRLRARVVASVAAVAMSGVAVVAAAVPAQARARSCFNIQQSIDFFEMSLDMDTGAYAQYYARDYGYWSYNVRLYYGSGC